LKNIIKATIKTGSSVVLINLFFIGTIKLIAVNFGSAGVGLFSLLKQIIATVSSIGLGCQTSVVLGVSKNKGIERNKFIAASFYFYLIISIFTALFFLIYAENLSSYVLDKSARSVNAIRLLIIPIISLIWYIYLKSIINGLKKIGTLSFLEVITPGFVFILLISMIKLGVFDEYAHIYVYIFIFSISQIASIAFSLNQLFSHKFNISAYRFSFQTQESKFLLRTSFITLITGIGSGISLFLVRAFVVKTKGLSEAGFFDISWTLSSVYPMIILTGLATYYLPQLSSLKNKISKNRLIEKYFRFSLITITPIITLIIVIKPILVILIASSDFLSSLKLMRWMLIADYFKITSWIFALAIFANHKIYFYLFSELIWYSMLAFIAFISMYHFGNTELIGFSLIILFLFSTANYFYATINAYKSLFFGNRRKLFKLWIVSLTSIIIFSFINWNNNTFEWKNLFAWVIFILLYANFFITITEKKFILSKFYKAL